MSQEKCRRIKNNANFKGESTIKWFLYIKSIFMIYLIKVTSLYVGCIFEAGVCCVTVVMEFSLREDDSHEFSFCSC